MTIIRGTFEVKAKMESPYSEVDGVALARAHVDKGFAGPLEGTSEVEMIGVSTPDPARRAYVAVERISGTVEGKRGTFVVLQQGAMSPEGMTLSVVIVAGSGTGALAGITGRMAIRIEGGQHFYELDYAL